MRAFRSLKNFKPSFFFLLVFVLLAFLPLIYLFVSGFVELSYPYGILNLKQWIFYWDTMANLDYIKVALYTLFYGIMVAFFGTLLGLVFSFFLERTDLPFKRLIKVLYPLSLILPPFVMANSWRMMFGTSGYLIQFLQKIGLNLSIDVYNIYAASIVLTLCFFPLATFLISSGMRRIAKSLEESALLVYSPLKVFFKITLPLIRPYILISIFFIFILAISEYAVFSLFHVWGKSLIMEMYQGFSAFFSPKYALSYTFPLLIFLVVFLILNKLLLKKRDFFTVLSASKFNLTPCKLKSWKTPSLIFIFLILSLSVIIPVTGIFLESISINPLMAYSRAFFETLGIIKNSLLISLLSSFLITSFSLGLSYFIRNSSFSGFYDGLISIPMIIPSILLAVGMIFLWNRPWNILYPTLFMMVLVFLVRFIPYSTKILLSGYYQLDRSLEEVSFLSGISRIRTYFKINLPLLKPVIIVSFLMSFILSLSEIGGSLFQYGNFQVLSVRIYNLTHIGSQDVVAALSMILIFIILITVGICIFFLKRFRGPKNRG